MLPCVGGLAVPLQECGNGQRQIFSFHIAGDIPDLQSLHLKTMDHNLGTLVQSTVAFVQQDSAPKDIAQAWEIFDEGPYDTLIDAAIFREWILPMGRREEPVRIAHLFCELFVKMRAVGLTRGYSCTLPITQATIGDALGLSTVHVNRSIMELRGRGLITLERQAPSIPKWRELQEYAGFDPQYLHMETPAEVT
jgi:hypothetical protein